jgi:hypothetical protein
LEAENSAGSLDEYSPANAGLFVLTDRDIGEKLHAA